MTEMALPVFMSWGRWTAKCPRPGCHNAEVFGRCDDGTVGGLTGKGFFCRTSHGGCGMTCPVQWPDNLEELEALLLARPAPSTRNWSPGEDAADLLRENVSNGLLPKTELDVIGGRILALPRELPPGPIEEMTPKEFKEYDDYAKNTRTT